MQRVERSEFEVLDGVRAAEEMREVYALATSLRADFRRVEDSYREADHNLRQSIISSEQNRGEVVDRLLQTNQRLLDTAEGQVAQQRVRADELAQLQSLPGNYLIIVENERALHLLPKCQETLAVLGSGNNLNWLSAGFLADKQIAYWGDLDTWGLRLLAHARQYRPELTAILMDFNTFSATAIDKAVVEPERAPLPEEGLKPDEQALFQKLGNSERGRLEQEFLPETIVHKAIGSWRSATRSIY